MHPLSHMHVFCVPAGPGRFDFLKTWFLNWEGLLIGGVFVGGLGVTAVKLYINERLDDLGR